MSEKSSWPPAAQAVCLPSASWSSLIKAQITLWEYPSLSDPLHPHTVFSSAFWQGVLPYYLIIPPLSADLAY